jgi:hypothetical protein
MAQEFHSVGMPSAPPIVPPPAYNPQVDQPTATAMPAAGPGRYQQDYVHPTSHVDADGAREFLKPQQWPDGMVNFLVKNTAQLPFRFFICDDSGSMATNDGNRLITLAAKTKSVRCTRWTELTDALRFHAQLARAMNAPTEFRFLNAGRPMVIGGHLQEDDFPLIMQTIEGTPGGRTPLCQHIREVIAKVKLMEPALRSTNQKAAIIICSDGESSDGDITPLLRELHTLPVWLVVRLCTDEEDVVNYWNSVDEQIETEMDVLDDFMGESQEVYSQNPWLTYALPMHRLREFGVRLKALDLIDEALLSSEQMLQVCEVLFDVPARSMPHPEVEFPAFIKMVRELDEKIPRVWSPSTQSLRNWVEPALLKRCYDKSGCCIIT